MEQIQIAPFLYILMAAALGYLFFLLFLLRHKGPKPTIVHNWPTVSVLVPFRNEESQIAGCCEALINLDYPVEKLEIFLLNDNSSDNSVAIASEKIRSQSHFKIINIIEQLNGLKAKMNVLAQGIPKAGGEYIFITDADCRPVDSWIKDTLVYYDDQTAMVSGFTVLKQESHSLFGLVQKMDWIYLQGLAYYSSNIDKPFTVIGNNLSFKKNIYDQTGGYEKIGFSITEDYALMRAILNTTPFKVRYIRSENSIVYSKPVATLPEFVRQRLRWIKGGLSARLYAYLLINSTFVMHLIVIYIFISGIWNPFTATIAGMTIGIEYFFMKRNLKALSLIHFKKYFLIYEIFYFTYPIILFLLLPFTKSLSWKGRKL